MSWLAEIFWRESIWLPKGYTWKQLENKPGSGIYIAQREDMLWSILGGFVMLGIRYFLERLVFTPIGYRFGVKKKKVSYIKPNAVLEEEFKTNGLVSNNNLEAVAKKTDMSVREVERWLRDRKEVSKPSSIQRFNEMSWQFLFYSLSFTYGITVLWDKPWLWETKYCWKNWPNLHVGRDIYWYYMFELSFYWSLVFTMLTDHKRKDFTQMIVHHAATILLVYFSWALNFARIGTLVFVLHDIGDVPLALAKMFKYCGKKGMPERCFAVFIVIWILSRLMYYPFVVLPSAIFELREEMGGFPAHYFFIALLLMLMLLHIMWSYMIAMSLYEVFQGRTHDVRSDSESDD